MRSRAAGLELSAADLAGHLACRRKTSLDVEVAAGGARGASTATRSAARPLWPNAAVSTSGSTWPGSERTRRRSTSTPTGPSRRRWRRWRRGGRSSCRRRWPTGVAWPRRRAAAHRRPQPVWRVGVRGCRHPSCRPAPPRPPSSSCVCTATCSAAMQGSAPEAFWIVTPGLPEGGSAPFVEQRHRVDAYAPYYRHVARAGCARPRRRGSRCAAPIPTSHCDICRWWQACDRQRREGRQLVAGGRHVARSGTSAGRCWGHDAGAAGAIRRRRSCPDRAKVHSRRCCVRSCRRGCSWRHVATAGRAGSACPSIRQ
jgi:hypothetical protein